MVTFTINSHIYCVLTCNLCPVYLILSLIQQVQLYNVMLELTTRSRLVYIYKELPWGVTDSHTNTFPVNPVPVIHKNFVSVGRYICILSDISEYQKQSIKKTCYQL